MNDGGKYVAQYMHYDRKDFSAVKSLIEKFLESGKPKLEVIFTDCKKIDDLQSQLTEANRKLEVAIKALEYISNYAEDADQRRETARKSLKEIAECDSPTK